MSEPAIIATRLAKTYGDVVALGGANVNGEH